MILKPVLLCIFYMMLGSVFSQNQGGCYEQQIDLCFMLDRSCSVTIGGWRRTLEFTNNVINSFNISSNLVQVGVISFASAASSVIGLGLYNTTTQLQRAIQQLPYTDTSGALVLATTMCFGSSNDRPNATNVAIFISEGIPTVNLSLVPVLHEAADKVVSIGVGPNITTLRSALANISKRLDEQPPRLNEDYFIAPNFDALKDLKQDIVEMTCEAVLSLGLTPPPLICSQQVDICFIIDHSGSVHIDDWLLTLRFVNRIIDFIKNSTEMANIGLIRFASYASVDIGLGTYATLSEVQKAIMQLPYSEGYQTNTADALTMTADCCFKTKGDRPRAPNVVIFLSDGTPTVNIRDLPSAIETLHESADIVISIGVGHNISKTVLANIAKTFNNTEKVLNTDFFLTPDFSKLESLVMRIATRTCPPTRVCRGVADVCFVLDSSGSIDQTGWQQALQFTRDITDILNRTRTGSNVGVVVYSDDASLEIELQSASPNLYQKISQLQFLSQDTNTAEALLVTARECFGSAGDRPNAQDIAIVITDGMASSFAPLPPIIAELHSVAEVVISIGVGNIDQDELFSIAKRFDGGAPVHDHDVFISPDYASLEQLVDQIAATSC